MTKTVLLTDETGEVVKLNTLAVRRAIQIILWNILGTDDPPPLKGIRINDRNCMLTINGFPILLSDRHHHYPLKKDHLYAIFDYLKRVEDALKSKIKENKLYADYVNKI